MRAESTIVKLIIFGILPISFVTAPGLCGMCSNSERLPPKKKSELLLEKINQAKQSHDYFIDQTSWIEDMKKIIVLDAEVVNATNEIIGCQGSTVILPSSDDGMGIQWMEIDPSIRAKHAKPIMGALTILRSAFTEAKIDRTQFTNFASAFRLLKDDNILDFMKKIKKRSKKNIPNTLLEKIRENIQYASTKRATFNDTIQRDLRTALDNLNSIFQFIEDVKVKKQEIGSAIKTRTENLDESLSDLFYLVDGAGKQMKAASTLLKKSCNTINHLNDVRSTMLQENNKLL